MNIKLRSIFAKKPKEQKGKTDHPVRLNFVFFESASLSLGFWLLIFLFLGSILGIGSSSIILIRYKRLIAKMKKKVSERPYKHG